MGGRKAGASKEPQLSLSLAQLPALHLLQTLCSQPVHSDLCGEVVSLVQRQWVWAVTRAEDEQVCVQAKEGEWVCESLLSSQLSAAVLPAIISLLATVAPSLHQRDLTDVNFFLCLPDQQPLSVLPPNPFSPDAACLTAPVGWGVLLAYCHGNHYLSVIVWSCGV